VTSVAESRPVAVPQLREATFADYEQISRVESTFFTDSLPPQERRRLFTDNPLWPRLADTWPVGWVLEDDDGRIVGSLNNIPSAYHLDGEQRISGNGHCWAVLEPYRGYATMLMDEYFNQERPDLLVSAKVGTDATPVWNAYAERVPVGDWATAAFAITGYRGFARTALGVKNIPLAGALAWPAAAALRVKDALTVRTPAPPAGVEFTEVAGFDERFDGFWRELLLQHPNTLLGTRDAASLSWHYGIPMRAGRVWIVTAVRNGMLRGYCVLKQHFRPTGLRSMKLVDFQTLEPDVDLLPGLLRIALRRAAAEGCFMLEHHGCGLPKTRGFDELARYRARKPSWSFYYHTEDAGLRARLADPAVWDPSEYDGDSSFK
jgi:hypothetical protein